jgi:hypothetical protein
MDIVAWINSHGVLVGLGGFMYALVVSCAPPLPDHAGYFVRWGYSAMQAFAANGDKIAAFLHPSSVIAAQTTEHITPQGEVTRTATAVESTVESSKDTVKQHGYHVIEGTK